MATELKGSISKGVTDTIIVTISELQPIGMENAFPARNTYFKFFEQSKDEYYDDTLH